MSSPTSAIDIDALFNEPVIDTPMRNRDRSILQEDIDPRILFEPTATATAWDPSVFAEPPHSPIVRPGPVTRSIATGMKKIQQDDEPSLKEATVWDPVLKSLNSMARAMDCGNLTKARGILENVFSYAEAKHQIAKNNNDVIWILDGLAMDEDIEQDELTEDEDFEDSKMSVTKRTI